jgi:hypothetical protein
MPNGYATQIRKKKIFFQKRKNREKEVLGCLLFVFDLVIRIGYAE